MTASSSTSSIWTRTCASVALIALVASVATTSRADQGPVTSQPDSALTDKARDLYNEGRDHYAAGRFDRAHASFLAAWALKRHWQIAGMLGECELKLNRYRDAAEHLAFALRSGVNQAQDQEIAAMRVSFAEARKHVGELEIDVDRVGAEVLVDGAVIGRTPLTEPVFVDAGSHELEARVEQREAVQAKAKVEAGGTEKVSLSFTAGGAVVPPSGSPAPETSDHKPSAVPAIVAGSVAVLGLGAGIGFTIARGNKLDDRDSLLESIGGKYACSSQSTHPEECAAVDDANDTASRYKWYAIGGFAAFGVGAAATYFLWPRDPSKGSAWVQPLVGPNHAGLQAAGHF